MLVHRSIMRATARDVTFYPALTEPFIVHLGHSVMERSRQTEPST
jgi:hypothetical protein